MENEQPKEWLGSVCAGAITSRWPFGKLVASPDHIELRSLLGNFVLSRNEIRSIERGGFLPWIWMGCRGGFPVLSI